MINPSTPKNVFIRHTLRILGHWHGSKIICHMSQGLLSHPTKRWAIEPLLTRLLDVSGICHLSIIFTSKLLSDGTDGVVGDDVAAATQAQGHHCAGVGGTKENGPSSLQRTPKEFLHLALTPMYFDQAIDRSLLESTEIRFCLEPNDIARPIGELFTGRA
jgi:hypothetical protein